MDYKKKIKIQRNILAYSFLFFPLLLLGVFVFYPLIKGIYISFMKYEILKRPINGGLVSFISAFFKNLSYSSNSLLFWAIIILSVISLVIIIRKNFFSRKVLGLFIIFLLLINFVALGNVLTKSFKEINYIILEDRVLNNSMAQKYAEVAEKKYVKKENVEIIVEPIGEEKSHVFVKQSIWIGWDNYKRMFKNKEYVEFVKNNNWYKVLLFLPVLTLSLIFTISCKMKEKRKNKINELLKILTMIIVIICIVVTWPRLFHSRKWLFYEGMENSLKYLMVVPPLQLGSILMAILVNQKIKGVKFFRTIYYIPAITGIVIIGYCWKWIFNPNGLLNSFLQLINILKPGEQIFWLSNTKLALWAVMFVTFWRGLGYYMVIYMAGLQSISNDIIEAAMIDGVSKFQMITKIYLPNLKSTIQLCTVLSIMAALKVFEEIYVLTNGASKTKTLGYLIYDKAFGASTNGVCFFQFGYSSAIAVVLSIIIAILTVITFKIKKKDV